MFKHRFAPRLVAATISGGLAVLVLIAALIPAAARGQTATTAGPSIVQHQLQNGLRILVLKDEAASKITAGLWIAAGWVHNPRGKEGLADLAATLDHLRVRQALTRGEVGKTYMAPDWSTDVTTDHAVFATSALPEDLDPLLAVLRAAIPAEDDPFLATPALKREALLKLLQTRSSADLVSREAMGALLYGDRRPLGFSARFPTILSIMPGDVEAFHRDYYRPANAILTVAGAIEPEAVQAAAERQFGSWPAGDLGSPVWGHAADRPARPGVTVIDDPDALSALILCGFTGPGREDPDFLEIQLLHQVIGSSRFEDLIAALAATHPMGYRYRTQLRASARGSELTIEVAIPHDLVARTIQEIDGALDDLATSGLSEEAFTGTVSARSAALALRYETPEARMFEAPGLTFAGQPLAAIEDPGAALAALDRQQVNAHWRELLAAERRVWIAHGRNSALAADLAAAGIEGHDADVFTVITGRLLTKEPDPLLKQPSAAATAQGEELLVAAIEAKGGFEAIERVESYAEVETLFVRPGGQIIAGERRLSVKFPDQMREQLRVGPLQGEGLVQTLNGTRAWRQQMGKNTDLPEWRRQDLVGRMWLDGFRAFHRYGQPGANIFLVDPQAVAGTTLDGFQITSPDGYWARYYLHPQSRQVVKRVTSRLIDNGTVNIEELFTDYRPVEGVFVPFISATYMDGEYSSESQLRAIEINPELPPDLFKQPQ